jgi:hypothetical protein
MPFLNFSNRISDIVVLRSATTSVMKEKIPSTLMISSYYLANRARNSIKLKKLLAYFFLIECLAVVKQDYLTPIN